MKILRKIAGIFLLLLGFLGLFLPLLPGLIFIALGIALLGDGRILQSLKRFLSRKERHRLSSGHKEQKN